jgi:hypothetical protein
MKKPRKNQGVGLWPRRYATRAAAMGERNITRNAAGSKKPFNGGLASWRFLRRDGNARLSAIDSNLKGGGIPPFDGVRAERIIREYVSR